MAYEVGPVTAECCLREKGSNFDQSQPSEEWRLLLDVLEATTSLPSRDWAHLMLTSKGIYNKLANGRFCETVLTLRQILVQRAWLCLTNLSLGCVPIVSLQTYARSFG